MIKQQSHSMSSHFMSMVQALAGLSLGDKLWHLKNNMGIDVNEDNLESLVHKLESIRFDQITTIYTITLTPAAALAEGLRC